MEWFKNNVLGLIPEKDWLTVGFNVNHPNDPLEAVFADQKTANLVAEWQNIANEYTIPVMAQFHGFDTEAQKTFRVPIDNYNIEKGLIKVKINQSEALRAYMRSGVQGEKALYDYVMNDGLRLADQVVTRSKVARAELMASGVVTIKENNLDLTVDYNVPNTHKNLTLEFGSGASTDIPTQLQTIIDNAKDEGVVLTGIVCSGKTVTKLRKNSAIQIAINGTYGAGALIRRSALEAYLQDEFGLSIIEDDLTFATPNGVDSTTKRPKVEQHRYYPIDKVTFFSTNTAGRIGTGLWGDPPEVDATRFMDVADSGTSPYVYISQWAENDPAVLWTKASALYMPVLYNPLSLYIATVTETSAG